MRKIFSSRRLENAEALARLLRDAGIEVKIENGRALHRAIRGNFSYLDSSKSNPPESEVWVIRSDDQPRARALMREAGLLQDTTRRDGPPQLFSITPRTQEQGKRRISRLRYGLLAVVLVVVAVNFMRPSLTPPAMPETAPAPARPALTMLDETLLSAASQHVIPTPPLLAVMLAQRALKVHPSGVLCLAIDGQDPPDTALDTLAANGLTVHPASTCPSATALHLDIHRYTTDGSGTGTVRLTRHIGTPHTRSNTQELHVRRSGAEWSVPGADRGL